MTQSAIKSLAVEITSKYAIHLTKSRKFRSLSVQLQGKVRKEAYKVLIDTSIVISYNTFAKYFKE